MKMVPTRREMLRAVSAGFLWGTTAFADVAPKPVAKGYEDAVLVAGEPPLPQSGSFTMVVLPDTQYYSEHFPETFTAQTRWVVDQISERRIACVLHLGDVTNTSSPIEWKHAQGAMRQLDDKVPYFVIPGNHDYSKGGSASDRSTLFSEYFPKSVFEKRPSFGGVYDKEPGRMENSYHRFEVAGRKILVLGLEFGPRKDVVRWANEIALKHADYNIILITHAYMYYNDSRYDWKALGERQNWNPHAYGVAKSTGGDVMDGTELWDNLVARHENFILALNGHVLNDGLGRLVSQTPAGRDVYQVLVNFQMRPHGGDGWLRLMEFRIDGTAQTYDYSPVLKQRNESAQNQFEMKLSFIEKT